MIRHSPLLPPEFIYPAEDWRVVERELTPRFLAQMESVFSTANGYLGFRGWHEEGVAAYEPGVFVNGFHETWPIPYGERAYGFATTGQSILHLPDAMRLRLYVEDEPFNPFHAALLQYERALDLRAGTLDRDLIWQTADGKRFRIRSRRLVSFSDRHVAAVQYEVTALNAAAPVVLVSEIAYPPTPHAPDPDDPRLGRELDIPLLRPSGRSAAASRIIRAYATARSGMAVACGMDHQLDAPAAALSSEQDDRADRIIFTLQAAPGATIRLTKFLAYHTGAADEAPELMDRARRSLDRVGGAGFDRLVQSQRQYLDDFWRRADVQISGPHFRAQQSMRWALFQLLQATARADGAGVPAKGLTGHAYDGHYFWDMEMFMLPFLTYTDPLAARNLLLFRYRMLDAARERAREVNQKGALFPWRTINGQEASASYASGTAQYHINAAIAYAVRRYVQATGDDDFLFAYGAEMLVETARLWFDLGFFSPRRGGRFCIHGVTGPDEYSAVVDNNTYTNLMAREHLRYAAEVAERIRRERPAAYDELVYRTRLQPSEPADWSRAAEAMYVAYDAEAGVHPQDDTFLDHPPWDLAGTPADHYPLLLHYHPLALYRHQVLKQTDVVMAMFLLHGQFTAEQKRRNFDYYDPLTTGDSSLSSCIQSIVAAELGYREQAVEYWKDALLMDLADVGGNVKDGCHIAALGGSWMAAVYGIAGMREGRDGRLAFVPRPYVDRLSFAVLVRGRRLQVSLERGSISYCLSGTGVTITHCGEEVALRDAQPVTRPISCPAPPIAAPAPMVPTAPSAAPHRPVARHRAPRVPRPEGETR